MKIRLLATLTICAATMTACGQKVIQTEQAVVPMPQIIENSLENEFFKLTPKTKIVVGFKDDKTDYAVAALNAIMTDLFGKELTVVESNIEADKAINILFEPAANEGFKGEEGYQIDIEDSKIEIKAATSHGVFNAVQTLRQLIPAEAFDTEELAVVELKEVEIEDFPEFAWRGMMFDVCRHFFTVEELKENLDMLAMHKINTFHWHLTEDQGWRIEIKKYPLLTEIGSVRKETVIGHNSGEYDGTPYGGFFTQEQVKEVVQYAAERFITVIPEIEIPGHSVAALAAYPWLGCTGEEYEVLTSWGVDPRVMCPGKETTFEFIENVLSEVIPLFPAEYFHIGGDECPTSEWAKCPDCAKRMKAEGIKNVHYLQSYVTARVEKFLNEHGKKLIGWDEILEGGVTPTATIMSWRGPQGGIKAAKQGNNAVMTPNTHCYLDYYQTKDRENEPDAIGGYLPLEQVYSLDPYAELTEEQKPYIIGVQGNLWTEYIPTYSQAQYMLLPRLSAIAEVGWHKADYESYLGRLNNLRKYYDHYGYNYAKHVFATEE